ncbi:MAG: bifunctional 2-C-methyl-D-erythritol 4-phosphate cytidylyltransferase/2-C-methyl-D-erythritol 2,4-cyclodiphosphate synthase [Kiloniellales bacterium]
MQQETVALVVAAGRGERFGSAQPKQYAKLAGCPLLRYSLESLSRHPKVTRVVAVIHPDDRPLYGEAAAGLALAEPVAGGASRQESVRLGLESLAQAAPARVLIHDAARPFVPASVIDRIIGALERAPGAIAALPLADSLKRAKDDRCIAGSVPRDGLWRAQTPQGFRFAEILAAHRAAQGAELTDDAAVAERAGLTVALIEGALESSKITEPADLAWAERWLAASRETRVGQGYDVHRFAPGDAVMLCGVRVPHSASLAGHSDADVGLHALTDAILGALGRGDIGQHFPPSEARWRGADSTLFVTHARDLVAERGGNILHVDVTLVCEVPKISPHRAAMVTRIAELLGIAPERVSVKATTTEGLGFAGRREGIAASAVATLTLPAPTSP